MARVLINALASTAGGGITYLRNVLPRLKCEDSGHEYLVLVPAEHEESYRGFGGGSVRIESASPDGGLLTRLRWEQTGLRRLLRERDIDVLISLGNFALLFSPVPQILFSRNDLYFSDYFSRDLASRGLYADLCAHRLKSLLARISIKKAGINVAPTESFARRIRAQGGMGESRIEVLPFGFDRQIFRERARPLNPGAAGKLGGGEICYRLLYVSHYNYFRNFETLIRALPLIKENVESETGKPVRLVLTTDIKHGAVYGGYDATRASELIDELGVRRDIDMLGPVPYEELDDLYRRCDLFVCPSYSESFGHPLLEAMASGLPVAAADLDVQREICGEAAVYFDVFDFVDLAGKCRQALIDNDLRQRLAGEAERRLELFSWDRHVEGLKRLIDRALAS